MERLDDAVTRILRVKFRAGLFEAGSRRSVRWRGNFKMLASPEQRALARQAVRESLVLLKNNGGLLPLAADKHVLVAGDGADDIGKQAGGWTITWQGTGLDQRRLPGRHFDLGRREGGGEGRWRQAPSCRRRQVQEEAGRGRGGVR